MADHITSILSENRVFFPPEVFREHAHIQSFDEYKKMYDASISDPEGFWAECAEDLDWFQEWHTVLRSDHGFFKWFEGGSLNVSYNCLDRHTKTWRKNKAAIIWEAEDGSVKTYTYQELLREVSRFANVLKREGLRRGDRVCIYLPMIPELVISMLACARIGVVHSIVFGGFSSDALRDRINDCEAQLLITADGSFRNQKVVPLKEHADDALQNCPSIRRVVVVKRCNNPIHWEQGRDICFQDEVDREDTSDFCEAEPMNSEDSLFILYTSGTTGKPKGVLHTQAGYLLYTNQTFKWVFDIGDDDVFFCTADIGWITGHSYITYGPLSNGATVLMYEGGPMYPKPDRFWQMVQRHQVSIFYTAPTAIRALARYGDDLPNKWDLSSLRLLGSVGEPINPEAWMWYHSVIGKERCPIVDTWWQTETGGMMIAPIPGVTPLKPGSATLPLPGIAPDIVKDDGTPAQADEGGNLVITKPWPGMLRTVWKNPERYKKTYFEPFGIYFSGDGAKRDKDGYFWVMGRLDDVLKVSGHRIGTAEVESALVSNEAVAEAAIVGMPHDVKGQAIYAFVTLKNGVNPTEDLKQQLRNHVGEHLGPIAKPDKMQFAQALPKTRSGKIMRRILKKIAEGSSDFGNTSTLANPEVVQKLYDARV